ncbi:MAG: hypothetical protein AABM40_04715 [Chloroflexota bacterium]
MSKGLANHRRRLATHLRDPQSRHSRLLDMLLQHKDLPKLWGMVALDMKHAADILWTRGATSMGRHWKEIVANTRQDGPAPAPELRPPGPGEDTLAQAHALVDTAEMLLGIAFENLIKGIVVAREPTLIKDGTPTGRLITHQIADLARAEGLLASDDEYRLLKILEQYVLWLGRYPMPREKESYQDLIGVDVGDDPLEVDKAALDALFDRLVHHPDMRWYP